MHEEIEHSCGHFERVRLWGSFATVRRQRRFYAGKPCSMCEAADEEEVVEAATEPETEEQPPQSAA